MGSISNPSSIFSKVVKRVLKLADEIVNNSSVLQNDNHLFFAVKAGEIWRITLFVRYVSVTTTPSLRCGWSLPAGATMSWFSLPQTVAWALEKTAADVIELRPAAGIIYNNVIEGVVTVGAIAGNVQLQWAQWTATVEDTTLKAQSCLIAHQLG